MKEPEHTPEEDLYFESSLTLEEIEANFKDVDIGEGVIEALEDVLQGKYLVVNHRH